MKIGHKLTLSFLLIVCVTAGTATLYSANAVGRAFQDYVLRNFSFRSEQFADAVTDYYRVNGWQGLQSYMQTGVKGRGPGMGMMQHRRQGMGPGMGLGMGAGIDRYLVADETGRIIADTAGTEAGNPMTAEMLAKGMPLLVDGKRIGTLISYQGFGQMEETFMESVKRANIIAGATALLLSLVLGSYLSGRLTRPLIALSGAARKIAGRDLSHRVAIIPNDEIGDVARSFNYMAEKLEQNETLRKNMLADIAHELRTPLSILQGNLESLEDGVIEAKPEVFASLHDETVRITRLVSDLQELAHAEAGELSLYIQPVDLTEIIGTVSARLFREAESHHIRLYTRMPEQPVRVQADAKRLEQVIYNLVVNAIKYTPAGGEINIALKVVEQEALVSVADTGIGIAAEDMPYIFDRFYRSDKSRSRETGGTGLGLAIAKGYIEAQGGRIWAESQPGSGAQFMFTVPLATG